MEIKILKHYDTSKDSSKKKNKEKIIRIYFLNTKNI